MDIIVAGDFHLSDRPLYLVQNNRFQDVLGNIQSIIKSADYSLVNLESPIVNSPDTSPLIKEGPNLKCSKIVMNVIKWAGFKCVTLANNHFYDYGEQGVIDTIRECERNNIDYVGGGMNINEASKVLYKKFDDKIVAFINCCEHEFSIATAYNAGSNPLNSIKQYYAIKEAKRIADYVVVIIHGGSEGYQLPSPRMKDTYRFFVDCGADVVINHHQHCYSGYEIYNHRPIFYGLGNFCFDSSNERDSIWNYGYMVKLILDKEIEFEIIPYVQCNNIPNVQIMPDTLKESFFEQIHKLNNIIIDDVLLQVSYKDWMDANEKYYTMVFSPYSNRYLRYACYWGILPNFLSKKKRLSLINYINCESHRDRTLNFLEKIIK